MEITKDKVEKAISLILDELGEPESDRQDEALRLFMDEEYEQVKWRSLANPTDYFIKCLGYLPGAMKLTPNTPTILAEALRAAMYFDMERRSRQLGQEIMDLFE